MQQVILVDKEGWDKHSEKCGVKHGYDKAEAVPVEPYDHLVYRDKLYVSGQDTQDRRKAETDLVDKFILSVKV